MKHSLDSAQAALAWLKQEQERPEPLRPAPDEPAWSRPPDATSSWRSAGPVKVVINDGCGHTMEVLNPDLEITMTVPQLDLEDFSGNRHLYNALRGKQEVKISGELQHTYPGFGKQATPGSLVSPDFFPRWFEGEVRRG